MGDLKLRPDHTQFRPFGSFAGNNKNLGAAESPRGRCTSHCLFGEEHLEGSGSSDFILYSPDFKGNSGAGTKGICQRSKKQRDWKRKVAKKFKKSKEYTHRVQSEYRVRQFASRSFLGGIRVLRNSLHNNAHTILSMIRGNDWWSACCRATVQVQSPSLKSLFSGSLPMISSPSTFLIHNHSRDISQPRT
jgi:hypothetical protein